MQNHMRYGSAALGLAACTLALPALSPALFPAGAQSPAVKAAAAQAPEAAPQTPDPQARQVVPVGGGSPYVTKAVTAATNRGLAYLAKSQNKEGYWAGDVGYKVDARYDATKRNAAHVGVTALGLMAFFACGEVPRRGRYGSTVQKAIDYLVRHTEENGYITYNDTRMYSHAFATLALAECYGMTREKSVRNALQRAVNLISDTQNREGGWRYRPFARTSDMSVTVCQVVALRAARNAGIFVPKSVINSAVTYVRRSARGSNERFSRGFRRDRRLGYFDDGVFKYQMVPMARASIPLTAAGVTTLYGAGIYKDPLIDAGLDYLSKRIEDYNSYFANHYFFYYGNYYAVQAFYMAGGRRFRKYWNHVSRYLLRRQARSGPHSGSWSCDTGPGRNFGTAVATLILAIPFQYLPIFQK